MTMSWEGADIERINSQLAGDIQRSYSLYSRVVEARYEAETITPEGLRTEHEESKLWRQFVIDSVALLPKTKSGSFHIPTDQKLAAQKIVESSVSAESYSGLVNPKHLLYLVGMDGEKIYLVSPQDENYHENWPENSVAFGPKPPPDIKPPVLYSFSPSSFDRETTAKLAATFNVLVSGSGHTLQLDDEVFRTLYYPYDDTYYISGHTDKKIIPRYDYSTITKIDEYDSSKFRFFARTITTAGIGKRLCMLAARFGVLDEHRLLLDTLSNDIMELRGINPAERERVREQAQELFGMAVMKAMSPEPVRPLKRSLFTIGRNRKNNSNI